MKIFGLASLALAASASFAVAGKLPKFERDLAAVALPLSQRTPQLAGRTDLQSTWDDASAMMIKMSLGDLLLEIPRLNEDAIKIQRALKTFRSMLLALNTAFAASVAEIIAQAGGGPLGQKSQAITSALSDAFLQTYGQVNGGFVNEVAQLISMFDENPSEYGQSLHDQLERFKSAFEPPCGVLSYDAYTNNACHAFMDSVDAVAELAAALNG